MAGGILPPLSVIASWPTPNYANPVQRGWGLVVVTIVLSVLSLSMVCARLWARFRARNIGIDDWIIVLAMIPAIGMSVLICLLSRMYGFNQHIWDNFLSTSINSRKVVMAIEATYLLGTGLAKISILLFYRRLVDGTFSRFFIWSVRIVIFSVFSYTTIFELTLVFGCRPISAYWDQVNPIWRGYNKYSCLDELATLYGANITSIVQDFLTFLMPLLLFTKLRLPKRQKIILGLIFSIGFLLCIVGIIRLVYTRNLYVNTYDVTWDSEPLWYWTACELHGAIMCASAPALKLFFKRYLKGSTSGSGPIPPHVQRINKGPKPGDIEKGVEISATDTTMSYGSEAKMTQQSAISTISTFIGSGSSPSEEWAKRIPMTEASMEAGWTGMDGGWPLKNESPLPPVVDAGYSYQFDWETPFMQSPLSLSRTLVNSPPRHFD